MKAETKQWDDQLTGMAERAVERVYAEVQCDGCGATVTSPTPGKNLAREAAIKAYNEFYAEIGRKGGARLRDLVRQGKAVEGEKP